MTLKYVKKIKGATDKNSAKNGRCKGSLTITVRGLKICYKNQNHLPKTVSGMCSMTVLVRFPCSSV